MLPRATRKPAIWITIRGLQALVRPGPEERPLPDRPKRDERKGELLTTRETKPESGLGDPKVNTRMVLATLWICHFILWIFGDMFSLMQEMGEPATSTAVQFVAPTTAIVLTLMVAFNLVGPASTVRMANLIVAPIYLLLNAVFFIDATHGWEYYLGTFYVLFMAAIMWRAYTWPTDELS
jgi:hypothetical protein